MNSGDVHQINRGNPGSPPLESQPPETDGDRTTEAMNITTATIRLSYSPLANTPSDVYCRMSGSGIPLVFLHGGWGYGIYPLKPEQMPANCTTVIPDRSGYGKSSKPPGLFQPGVISAGFGPDFHQRAAQETLLCLDQLGLKRCIFWGHSDGAVIAAMIGLSHPERCVGVILEAIHYDARKGSQDFFRSMISEPESFGPRVTAALAREHGDPYWRVLLQAEGAAWGRIAAAANNEHHDLYQGRLAQLKVPVCVIHGARDPRTEPGELESVRRALPRAAFHLIENAAHSPHSETASASQCTEIVLETVSGWKASQSM